MWGFFYGAVRWVAQNRQGCQLGWLWGELGKWGGCCGLHASAEVAEVFRLDEPDTSAVDLEGEEREGPGLHKEVGLVHLGLPLESRDHRLPPTAVAREQDHVDPFFRGIQHVLSAHLGGFFAAVLHLLGQCRGGQKGLFGADLTLIRHAHEQSLLLGGQRILARAHIADSFVDDERGFEPEQPFREGLYRLDGAVLRGADHKTWLEAPVAFAETESRAAGVVQAGLIHLVIVVQLVAQEQRHDRLEFFVGTHRIHLIVLVWP